VATPTTITIIGRDIGSSTLRARLDPDAPTFSGSFRNVGPASIEHSASADMSTPTTVAANATSGAITGRRYLRSLGKSTIWCSGVSVEGEVRDS
jgi:hypothetical protein